MDNIQITHWSKFGAVLKERRHSLGLSQHELADRAQVSRSWLARVETGHRGAEFEPLLRLVRALDLKFSVGDAHEEAEGGTSLPDRVLSAAAARDAAWKVGESRG